MSQEWIGAAGPTSRPNYDYKIEPILWAFEEFGLDLDSDEVYLIKRLLTRRTTIASANGLRGSLVHFFRWTRERGIQLFDLDYDAAEDYAASLHRARYMGGTKVQFISAARSFYEEALRRKLVAFNPFHFVKVKKGQPRDRTPSLTKAEVESVLAAIHQERGDLEFGLTARRDYALVLLLAWTAIRSIELHRLRWMDFFEQRGETMARIHGKGGKDVDATVPAKVIEALSDWRSAFEASRRFQFRPFDPVFPSLSPRHRFEVLEVGPNDPLRSTTSSRLSEVVHRRLSNVGIRGKRFRAHAMRATAATVSYAGGADIAAVSRLLRHESLQTTQGYIDWDQAIRSPAQDRLGYVTPDLPRPASPVTSIPAGPLKARGRRRKRLHSRHP